MRQFFSDLNLNGVAPVRVHPKLGEWAPPRVPTTSEKKRARITVVSVTVGVAVAVFFLGFYFYRILMGIA